MFRPGELYSQIRRRASFRADPPQAQSEIVGSTAGRPRAFTSPLLRRAGSSSKVRPHSWWDSGDWKEFKLVTASPDTDSKESNKGLPRLDTANEPAAFLNDFKTENVDESQFTPNEQSSTVQVSKYLPETMDSRNEDGCREDSFIDENSIVVYLEEDSPHKPERVELVFINPVPMEMPVPARSHDGTDDNYSRPGSEDHDEDDHSSWSTPSLTSIIPLAQLLDDLQATRVLERHKARVSSIGLPPAVLDLPGPQWWRQYINTVRELFPSIPSLPLELMDSAVFAEPTSTARWICKAIREKWTRNRESSAVNQRLLSKEDKPDPGTRGHEVYSTLGKKRQRMREAFKDCVKEQLRELWIGLQAELHPPVKEIDELHGLLECQQYLLLQNFFTFFELVDSIDKQQVNMVKAAKESLEHTNDQLEALHSLIGLECHKTVTVETRISRLSAQNVKDHVECRTETEQRLSSAEGLLCLSKAWQDVQFLRDSSQTAVSRYTSVEDALRELVRRAMDLHVAAGECACVAS